ncbi:MAG: phage holin family protein [Armatimonadetes bacterium]|nr:phage holin family protein [Armatimonadota bacterium]
MPRETMKGLLYRWVLLTASVAGAALVANALSLAFVLHVGSAREVAELFLGSAVLALANATLGRILKLLTLPLRCMTFGLFSLVINGLILLLVAKLDYGFTIRSQNPLAEWIAAIVGSVLITLIHGLLRALVPDP